MSLCTLRPRTPILVVYFGVASGLSLAPLGPSLPPRLPKTNSSRPKEAFTPFRRIPTVLPFVGLDFYADRR